MKLDRIFTFGRRRRRTMDNIQGFATVIGAESVVVGNLTGKDNHLVHGRVVGDCDLEGCVMLAPGGRWQGNIVAANVIIAGEVQGDITARDKLELKSSASIRGSLGSPVIAIEQGAAYHGEIRMGRQTQVTRYTERRGVAPDSVPQKTSEPGGSGGPPG